MTCALLESKDDYLILIRATDGDDSDLDVLYCIVHKWQLVTCCSFSSKSFVEPRVNTKTDQGGFEPPYQVLAHSAVTVPDEASSIGQLVLMRQKIGFSSITKKQHLTIVHWTFDLDFFLQEQLNSSIFLKKFIPRQDPLDVLRWVDRMLIRSLAQGSSSWVVFGPFFLVFGQAFGRFLWRGPGFLEVCKLFVFADRSGVQVCELPQGGAGRLGFPCFGGVCIQSYLSLQQGETMWHMGHFEMYFSRGSACKNLEFQ